jgi:hypothetical protein
MSSAFTTIEVFCHWNHGGSQSMNDDDVRCMQPAKKHLKVATSAISFF